MLARTVKLLAATAAIVLCSGAVRAADISENSAQQVAQQGIDAYNRGDFVNAAKYLEARVRMTPEDANVYYYLANCYWQNKQKDQAARMYSACVRLSPTSQAGKFSLNALERLSTSPAAPEEVKFTPADPKAVAAARDALTSSKPVDQAYNEALRRIKADRPTFKAQVDILWQRLQNELGELQPRARTYPIDLERVRREAELGLEEIQLKELRHECRVLAPDKIDLRSAPDLPQEKPDDSKTALGVLHEYFKPEKPFDPFDTNLTPDMTANFLNIKDVFGDLKMYDKQAVRMALQSFRQLKSSIENRQDNLDREVMRNKQNLLRDIIEAKLRDNSSGRSSSNNPYRQQTIEYQLSVAKMGRADEQHLTQLERDISDLTQRCQRRVKELQSAYDQQVDSSLSGAKEQLAALVGPGMNTQLKHVSGNIQLVPLGTDLHTHNYANFGDRSDMAPLVEPLKAKALKGSPAPAKKKP